MRKGPMLLTAVLTVVYGGFWIWYGGSGKPMDQAEIDRRITSIANATVAKGETPDEHILESLRSLAATDDGNEYYMVNLIRYRKKALYPAELQKIYGNDPRKADARYSEMIVPHLLRRGSIPVLLSEYEGRFLHPEGATEWDVVAIVRYRSRRDMMAMLQDIASSPAVVRVHKWASIERTQVFPVKPKFDFVMVRLTVLVALVVLGMLLHLILGFVPGYRRRRD